ncbi:hypothetical protein BACCIP111895_00285 [Neobacillus rhizosphaerae]|uniref:DUF5698 domain-containing protein n=1 Tax=Neobacillus rhizosphaerae TaxID=2880965 RepID=A0ABM9EKQ1_9BACI|nr:hypothetical protein BACCIP111895_00285 [Neobacillus rhizosphaerae]
MVIYYLGLKYVIMSGAEMVVEKVTNWPILLIITIFHCNMVTNERLTKLFFIK